MKTVITYLPDNASFVRGTYAVIDWPQKLQSSLQTVYQQVPPITIGPPHLRSRDLNLLDIMDLLFLWRSGEDLTDTVCSFLWEQQVTTQEEFEEQVLVLEENVVVAHDLCEEYLVILPKRRWTTQRFIGERLLVVAS